MKKNIIFASGIGNAVDIYDLLIFGLMTPFIAHSFFPANEQYGLVKVLFIFGVGCFSRPLGAVFFGMLGDYKGRRWALYVSIILMSTTTLLMTILPGYETLGPLSIVMLLILRLLQGFAMGSEFTNAITFLVEHSASQNHGFWGSVAILSANIGAFMAALVSTVFTYLQSVYHFNSEYWRLTFALSLIGALIGIYFRSHVPESLAFIQTHPSEHKTLHPFKQLFKKTTLEMTQTPRRYLGLLLMSIQSCSSTYFLTIYTPLFLSSVAKMHSTQAYLLNLLTSLILTISLPFAGLLSDRLKRTRTLAIAYTGLLPISFIYFHILITTHLSYIMPLLCLATILTTLALVSISVLLVETMRISIRTSMSAVIHSLSVTVFGSLIPFLSQWIIQLTHHSTAPGWLMQLFCIGGIIGLLLFKNAQLP